MVIQKEPGFIGFENSQPFQIKNEVKMNKQLLGKAQIQGIISKTWSTIKLWV